MKCKCICTLIVEECKCYKIEKNINKKFPDASWNLDSACKEWQKESEKLKNNNLVFQDGDERKYACTCPTCGRVVCGWCV